MTTRSNTIVRPGGLLRWALCLAALVSLLPLRAADDAIMIDTSDMDFDASRELLLDVIRGSVSN